MIGLYCRIIPPHFQFVPAEGLIHISEISWTKHIKHPSDIYKIGDIVDTIVLSIDSQTKKISLGVKQLEDNPWNEIEKKIKVNENCKFANLQFLNCP